MKDGPAQRYASDLERIEYQVFRSPAGPYFSSPAAFCEDGFDWDAAQARPTNYQLEALEDMVKYGRECVRGLHGLGKTGAASWAAIWFALTRDGRDWKLPTTSTSWNQLKHYLWPEIHKWLRYVKWDVVGRPPLREGRELLDMAIHLDTGEAFAVASNDPDRIEGAHGDSIMYLYEEAKGIPDKTWDASEGAFSGAGADTGGEAFALAFSTPGAPAGRFWAIQSRQAGYEDWHVRRVTLEEAADAGRVSLDWAEQRRKQWGENSPRYQQRVLGNFFTDEDAVIPLDWVELAQQRWLMLADGRPEPEVIGTATALAVDVGDSGPDETIVAVRYGLVTVRLLAYSRADPMQTTGHVTAAQDACGGGTAVVDTIGVGSGVGARLKELGRDWVAFVASASAGNITDRSGSMHFANLRAAAWWGLRERLDPDNGDGIALPPDEQLTGDLTAPRWKPMSNGRILIEPKDGSEDWGIRQRIGRSTDRGDAVAMAYALELLRPRRGPMKVADPSSIQLAVRP